MKAYIYTSDKTPYSTCTRQINTGGKLTSLNRQPKTCKTVRYCRKHNIKVVEQQEIPVHDKPRRERRALKRASASVETEQK